MPKEDVNGPPEAWFGCKAGGGYCCDRFYTDDEPTVAYGPPGPDTILGPEEEIALLKDESKRLKSVLESIELRLRELEG